MKGMNVKLLALCASALLFYGCEKEDDLLVSDKTTSQMVGENCDVISFDNVAAGTYVTQVTSSGGMVIGVNGTAMNSMDMPVPGNRARIFDSENWTGDDDDLATTDWGHILIVQDVEDTPAEPNDNKYGAKLTLTFPEPVTLNSMKVLDIDDGTGGHPVSDLSYAYVYVAGNPTPIVVHLEPHGDNVGFTVDFGGIENVVRLEVVFDGSAGAVGSGAIDDIMFCVPEQEYGCTRTQGYWKTHSGIKKNNNGNAKYDATWDDYLNSTLDRLGSTTYPYLLWMEPKGGDANLILAHQFIAAELNVAAGASIPGNVLEVWLMAQAYFAGDREATRSELIAWAEILDDYNNGVYGPGHCD